MKPKYTNKVHRLIKDGANLAVRLSTAMRLLEEAQYAAAKNTWAADDMDAKINHFFLSLP